MCDSAKTCTKLIVRTCRLRRSVQGKNTQIAFATEQEPASCTILIGPDVGPTGSVRQWGRRGWPLVVFGYFCPYKSNKGNGCTYDFADALQKASKCLNKLSHGRCRPKPRPYFPHHGKVCKGWLGCCEFPPDPTTLWCCRTRHKTQASDRQLPKAYRLNTYRQAWWKNIHT